MRLPKVSVLVPAFNEEKYIIASLRALAAQDYPDFEIIVTDNASTDSTAFLVEQFIRQSGAGVPVQLVSENRKGTNFARECARKAATGSVIAQVDADCIPANNWLRRGVTELTKRSAVAVTGPYDYFDGSWLIRRFSLVSQQLLYPVVNYAAQLTGRAAILIGGNALIRAEALQAIGGYDTSLSFYGDDVALAARLSEYGRVIYCASLVQPTSARRYRAQGFWKVNRKYQACFWKLLRNEQLLGSTLETSHPR